MAIIDPAIIDPAIELAIIDPAREVKRRPSRLEIYCSNIVT